MSTIGDLVATLAINSSAWTDGLKKADTDLGSFASSAGSRLADIAGTLGLGLGAMVSLDAAREDAQAMQALEAVLQATGNASIITSKEIGVLASQLQAVTNYGDEATVSAAAIIGTLKNLDGSGFKQAISLAQDMATVLKVDLDGAAKKLVKSLKDLSPEEATKKLADFQSQFGGAAQATVDPMTQLRNLLGDINEEIGRVLGVALKPLQQFVIPFLAEWNTSLGRVAVAIGITAVAMRVVVGVQKSIAVGQALILALAGPAGWANIAAGAAVFAVALVGINTAMGDAADTAQDLQVQAGAVGVAMEEAAKPVNFLKTSVENAYKAVESADTPSGFEKYQKDLENVARSYDLIASEAEKAGRSAHFLDRLDAEKADVLGKMVDRFTGFSTKLEDVNNEIRILRGEATAASIELEKMAKAGLDPAKIEELRKAMELRDQLKADQDAKRKAKTDANAIGKPQVIAPAGAVGAMQKGSAEAVSAILAASREHAGGKDAGEETAQNTNEMVALLENIERKLTDSDSMLVGLSIG